MSTVARKHFLPKCGVCHDEECFDATLNYPVIVVCRGDIVGKIQALYDKVRTTGHIVEEKDLEGAHFFCVEAFNLWMKIHRDCPTCRADLTEAIDCSFLVDPTKPLQVKPIKDFKVVYTVSKHVHRAFLEALARNPEDITVAASSLLKLFSKINRKDTERAFKIITEDRLFKSRLTKFIASHDFDGLENFIKANLKSFQKKEASIKEMVQAYCNQKKDVSTEGVPELKPSNEWQKTMMASAFLAVLFFSSIEVLIGRATLSVRNFSLMLLTGVSSATVASQLDWDN